MKVCWSLCLWFALSIASASPLVAEEEEVDEPGEVAGAPAGWLSLLPSPRSVVPGDLRGFLAIESRVFFHEEQFAGQRQDSGIFSLLTQPEWYFDWNDGDDSILFTPFFRYDSVDPERTHFDIREFYYLHVGDDWEVRAGIGQVFWGVTESQHLIDIVNQWDSVEDLDREDKLGQPMVHGTLIRDLGNFEVLVMSGFRERTFPGARGRLRPPFVVDQDAAIFESDLDQAQVDVVGRWSHTLGDFDVALYHFYGTNRDPSFVPDLQGETIRLLPHYSVINQTAVEAQYTGPDLLLKLEAYGRDGEGSYRAAFVAGFEYTLVGLCDTAADLGLVSEFHFDSQDGRNLGVPYNPFERDLFVGFRLTKNDVQSSALLAGVIVDVDDGGRYWTVEASRRLWDSFKLEIDLRLFDDIPGEDFASSLLKDDFIQARLAWYF